MVLWLKDKECLEVRLAGGKGASLAAMTAADLPVPPGFVIPSTVLEQSVDVDRLRALSAAGKFAEAQALVRQTQPPREEILEALSRLGTPVAVRSSACAEDGEVASYAGQQETFLYVADEAEVCERVVECWASFFSERALFYRDRKGSLDDLGMAVVIQKMLDPEKSGVMFTADPINRRKDRMIVEAVFGVGEQAVSGSVTPDHYVLDRSGAIKRQRLVNGGVLDPGELQALVDMGRRLEERFQGPQDVEWALLAGHLYLLQSRPITTL